MTENEGATQQEELTGNGEPGARLAFDLAEARAELARTREIAGLALDAAVSAISTLHIITAILRKAALTPEELTAFAHADAEIKQASDKLLNFMLKGA